jgi:hypothetical protein
MHRFGLADKGKCFVLAYHLTLTLDLWSVLAGDALAPCSPRESPWWAVSDSVGVSAYNADLMSTLEVVTPLAFVPQSVLTLWRNTEIRFR